MSNHERGGPNAGPQRPSPDDALGHAWRDASDEQPPAQLDAAILAAARQAVPNRRVEQAAPTIHAAPVVRVRPPSRFKHWQPLAVAASVVGLAFVLVQTLPREPDFSASTQSLESVPSPVSSPPTQPTQPTVPPATNAVPPPAAKERAHPQPRAEARNPAPSQRAVPAPPLEPSESTAVAEVAPSSNGVAVATDMAAAAAPARDSAAKAMQRLDPTDWAARIEAQYAAGDVAGAADRLRAFRAIEPEADQYLPDRLRAWARSVE